MGKLTFVPMLLDGVAVGYRFTGEATFSRPLAGEAGSASRVGGPNGNRPGLTGSTFPVRGLAVKPRNGRYDEKHVHVLRLEFAGHDDPNTYDSRSDRAITSPLSCRRRVAAVAAQKMSSRRA
jgi:hypothetical protein